MYVDLSKMLIATGATIAYYLVGGHGDVGFGDLSRMALYFAEISGCLSGVSGDAIYCGANVFNMLYLESTIPWMCTHQYSNGHSIPR